MAGKKRIHHAILATIAVLALATACGRAVVPGTAANDPRIVRDPDNPAYIGVVPATGASTGGSVIRDPENPYWTGQAATREGPGVIRDPDNPYWNGR